MATAAGGPAGLGPAADSALVGLRDGPAPLGLTALRHNLQSLLVKSYALETRCSWVPWRAGPALRADCRGRRLMCSGPGPAAPARSAAGWIRVNAVINYAGFIELLPGGSQ